MDVSELSYVRTAEREDWVLVEDGDEYAIVNRRTRMALLIEDDEAHAEVAGRMLEAGCRVYASILDAYADV